MIKSAFCILVLKWLNHSKTRLFSSVLFFTNWCPIFPVFEWLLSSFQMAFDNRTIDNHDLTIQISDMSGIRIPTVSFKKHISCAQKWSIYNLIYVILKTNLRRAKIVNFSVLDSILLTPLCTEIGQHFFLSTDSPKNILTTNILHN